MRLFPTNCFLSAVTNVLFKRAKLKMIAFFKVKITQNLKLRGQLSPLVPFYLRHYMNLLKY